MTVTLRQGLNLSDVHYICHLLRERDKEEIYALRYHDDPDKLALEVMMWPPGFAWTAFSGDTPVAIIGAAPRWPNVWSVFCFGTDRWQEVVLTLTRHVRKFMIPALYNQGAVRADCWALDTHEDARKWLTRLGAEEGAGLDNYGKNGQRFSCYSWTREKTLGDKSNVC